MNSSTTTTVAHRSTTNVSATHVDDRAILGMDKVTNVAIFLLSKHATLKVKRTALTIEIDETHSVAAVARHDGTTDSHFVSIKSLSSADTVSLTDDPVT